MDSLLSRQLSFCTFCRNNCICFCKACHNHCIKRITQRVSFLPMMLMLSYQTDVVCTRCVNQIIRKEISYFLNFISQMLTQSSFPAGRSSCLFEKYWPNRIFIPPRQWRNNWNSSFEFNSPSGIWWRQRSLNLDINPDSAHHHIGPSGVWEDKVAPEQSTTRFHPEPNLRIDSLCKV